jgi:uncharacterized protein YndB with AHSA1/START domain
MTEPLVVRRETHMAASPATVLAFLTDPEEILSWVGTQAHPGGLYLVKGHRRPHPCGARSVPEVVPILRMTHSGFPNASQCAHHEKPVGALPE